MAKVGRPKGSKNKKGGGKGKKGCPCVKGKSGKCHKRK